MRDTAITTRILKLTKGHHHTRPGLGKIMYNSPLEKYRLSSASPPITCCLGPPHRNVDLTGLWVGLGRAGHEQFLKAF